MRFQNTLLVAGVLVASLCGGVLGGLMVTAPVLAERVQSPAPVTASQVNVVDPEGRLRAVLSGRDEQRMASLSLYDATGQARAVVGVDDSGTPLLRLFDSAGQGRLSAVVQGDDALVVVGDERAVSGVYGSLGGMPLLSFTHAGQSRVRLQLGPDGSPTFGLFGPDGEQSVALTVDAAGAPLMTLHEEGRVRAALGVQAQTAVLNLADAGQARLVIGVAENGRPSISFLDEDGRVVQELPLPTPPRR